MVCAVDHVDRIQLQAADVLDESGERRCGQSAREGTIEMLARDEQRRDRPAGWHGPSVYTANKAFSIRFLMAENLTGGGIRRTARLGVAALLSASHPDIDYPLTPEEVIERVRSGNVDRLEELTPLPCPLP